MDNPHQLGEKKTETNWFNDYPQGVGSSEPKERLSQEDKNIVWTSYESMSSKNALGLTNLVEQND